MIRSSATPADCSLCRLCRTRTNVVSGIGPESAPVAFIGEAPGKDEDLRGEPFVGRAGRVLNDALAIHGVSRYEVFITNLVKCRPPENRRPRRDEIAACETHLCKEMNCIRPRAVCILGQTVARTLLGSKDKMAELTGVEIDTSMCGRDVKCVVAYHPAACLYRRTNRDSFVGAVERALRAGGVL